MQESTPSKEEIIDGEALEKIRIFEAFQREESLRKLIDKQRIFRQIGFKIEVSKKKSVSKQDAIQYNIYNINDINDIDI